MDSRYNIYFSGGILDGHDRDTVCRNIGQLFKANAATLDKLFSGKPQLLKRSCDHETALKYQQAMARAGARAIVRPVEAASTPTQASAAPAMTKAERIAAIAAGAESAPRDRAAESATPQDSTGIQLAPAGTEVLRADERKVVPPRDVDTSELSLAAQGTRLAAPAAVPPPAPDTEHLSVAAVGADLGPTATPQQAPEQLGDDLELSPQGTDFSDCAVPDAAVPDLDLSYLELSGPGADLLDARYRDDQSPSPPATDHLDLEH